MTISINSLIEHLKGTNPYGKTETYKLWEALQFLNTESNTLDGRIDELLLLINSLSNINVQKFTSVGTSTWVLPSGWKSAWIEVELIGGGGGGGGGGDGSGGITGTGGGGAGAGEYKRGRFLISNNQTIIIGDKGIGGAHASNGTDGGQTSFGSFLLAKGGNKGGAGTTGGAVGSKGANAGSINGSFFATLFGCIGPSGGDGGGSGGNGNDGTTLPGYFLAGLGGTGSGDGGGGGGGGSSPYGNGGNGGNRKGTSGTGNSGTSALVNTGAGGGAGGGGSNSGGGTNNGGVGGDGGTGYGIIYAQKAS